MKKRESAVPAIIGCLVAQLCVGILYLWSVFKSPIVATFHLSSGAATMISSYMPVSYTHLRRSGQCAHTDTGEFADFLCSSHGALSRVAPVQTMTQRQSQEEPEKI